MSKKKKRVSSSIPQNSVGELLNSDNVTLFLEKLAADRNVRGLVVITAGYDGQIQVGCCGLNSFEMTGVMTVGYNRVLYKEGI